MAYAAVTTETTMAYPRHQPTKFAAPPTVEPLLRVVPSAQQPVALHPSADPSGHSSVPAACLTQAALLNWLGQTPISFHRVYVDMTGSVVAGLWLSHALAKAARAQAHEFEGNDFVFAMSARECELATGITRAQQVNCRQSLSRLGLLDEEGGKRKTPTFRLHMDAVAQRMLHASEPLAQTIAANTSAVSTPSAPMRLRD